MMLLFAHDSIELLHASLPSELSGYLGTFGCIFKSPYCIREADTPHIYS